MANGAQPLNRYEARSTEGEKAVQAYAKGVRKMKERDANDPTSWDFQAAIHGSHSHPEEPPWNQCEHESWFFFPWHRIYLYYFERIVRKAVVEAGGEESWSLPYWNYGLEGENGALPDLFLKPDNQQNPLYVAQRNQIRNAGWPIEGMAVAEEQALQLRQFEGNAMFGGEKAPAKARFWEHQGRPEGSPHGAVHNQIGGWMKNPDTAAQDPIFWLHHANIDRIWAVWNEREGGANPNAKPWREQGFEFFDADGKPAAKTCEEVTATALLGYTYDPDPGS